MNQTEIKKKSLNDCETADALLAVSISEGRCAALASGDLEDILVAFAVASDKVLGVHYEAFGKEKARGVADAVEDQK